MEIADRYGIPVVEDAAEGLGSRFGGRCLGTFGRYGVLSFNGNKMITTSGGGALICGSLEEKNRVKWYATQAREAYPFYQHEAIGYNYRLSNISAGIGRGQMFVLDEHIAHHRHIKDLYKELFKEVPGIELHDNPGPEYDSNFWLNTVTIDPWIRIKGQENAYKETVSGPEPLRRSRHRGPAALEADASPAGLQGCSGVHQWCQRIFVQSRNMSPERSSCD